MQDKTQQTNTGSQTDKLKNDSEQQDLAKTTGSIAGDGVKTEALKPGSAEAARDSSITSANPAFAAKESQGMKFNTDNYWRAQFPNQQSQVLQWLDSACSWP